MLLIPYRHFCHHVGAAERSASLSLAPFRSRGVTVFRARLMVFTLSCTRVFLTDSLSRPLAPALRTQPASLAEHPRPLLPAEQQEV